jgi:nitrogen fixation/metabolism regulation signal transduction histidine kinase
MAQENRRLNEQLQAVNAELSMLNSSLERHVEDKTRELRLNIHALRVSQAGLEELPLAVLGVGDDGQIAVANRVAHELFSGSHEYLIGQMLTDVLPPSIAGLCEVLAGPGALLDREVSIAGLPRVSLSCARLGDTMQTGGKVVVMRRL